VRRPALILILSAFSVPAFALRFSIASSPPYVFIQIGHGDLGTFGLFGPPSSQVDEVSFPIPPGVSTGDGTPIVGTPVIPIAFLGYSGGNRANYQVTMSATGRLSNGAGGEISFSEISWATQDGDIPGGVFSDIPVSQFLQQYNFRGNRSRGVVDYLTFSYANTTVPPAGTYTGRITYTITLL
jgi:hypothetical protein